MAKNHNASPLEALRHHSYKKQKIKHLSLSKSLNSGHFEELS
jgi:hypothetical protein